MTGYECFREYVLLKLYLSGRHDLESGIRLPRARYDERADRELFERLALEEKPERRILACIIAGCDHVSKMTGMNGRKMENAWRGRTDALSYNLDMELRRHCVPLEEKVRIPANGHPRLLTDIIGGRVSLETATILNSVVNYADEFDRVLGRDPSWELCAWKVKRYNRLLKYDRERIRWIVEKHVRPSVRINTRSEPDMIGPWAMRKETRNDDLRLQVPEELQQDNDGQARGQGGYHGQGWIRA